MDCAATVARMRAGFSSRRAVAEFAVEDFTERRVGEAVEAPDRIELAHVDIAACHHPRIDVDEDHFADQQRLALRPELEDALKLALEMDRRPP